MPPDLAAAVDRQEDGPMRSAYIGFSGPIGYDYQHESDAGPNPVLEDVTGLLLCYDELVFFSRDLCPKDMRHLDYVRFVTDSNTDLASARVAIDQYAEVAKELPVGEFGWDVWRRVVATVTGGDGAARVDNHSRSLVGLSDLPAYGNSAQLENAILDVGVAASLGLQGLDVLTNSAAQRAVDASIASLDRPNLYNEWHLDIADSLGAIRVTNAWDREGGYFEALEELRHHHKVEDFRAFLSTISPDATEAAERASEISALADHYARTVLIERHRPRSIFKTVGRAAIAPLGNAVHPGAGSAAAAGVKAFDWAKERRWRAKTAWAAFVVELQAKP